MRKLVTMRTRKRTKQANTRCWRDYYRCVSQLNCKTRHLRFSVCILMRGGQMSQQWLKRISMVTHSRTVKRIRHNADEIVLSARYSALCCDVLWCDVMLCVIRWQTAFTCLNISLIRIEKIQWIVQCNRMNAWMNEWQQIEVNNHSRIEDLHSVIWWLNRVWRLFRAQAYHSIELPQLFKWLSTISIAAQNMLAYFVGVDLTTLCMVSCAPLILHICRNVIGVV